VPKPSRNFNHFPAIVSRPQCFFNVCRHFGEKKLDEPIGFRETAESIPSRNGVARWYFFIQKTTILQGLGMENVGTFNGHLEYFIVIWYIILSFGIFIIIW
jgi:hypothetical protein